MAAPCEVCEQGLVPVPSVVSNVICAYNMNMSPPSFQQTHEVSINSPLGTESTDCPGTSLCARKFELPSEMATLWRHQNPPSPRSSTFPNEHNGNKAKPGAISGPVHSAPGILHPSLFQSNPLALEKGGRADLWETLVSPLGSPRKRKVQKAQECTPSKKTGRGLIF